MATTERPELILDLSAIVAFGAIDGQIGRIANDEDTTAWVSRSIRSFLTRSGRRDRAVVLRSLGHNPANSPVQVAGNFAEELHQLRGLAVHRRTLLGFYGEDAISRMEQAVRQTWEELGLPGVRRLAKGLLEQLFAVDVGLHGRRGAPVASISIGKGPDGTNPVKEALKRFGRRFLSKADPVFEKVGPLAEDWEKRKIEYGRKLLRPTRRKLESDALAIFITAVLAIQAAMPWGAVGAGGWVVYRVGDFTVDGG